MDKIDLKNFIYLTIAGIVNAFGVTIFLAPVKLYDSGISGTSMLLSQMTPPYMSLSFFLILLNIPLFMFGLKKQGREFTVYAVYAVMVYSIAAWYITEVSPIDVSVVSPLAGSDLLLCALFGGMISGTGSGIALRYGGAMDGIEVMAVIFSKKLGVTVGIFVMVYNVILYVVCGLILSSWVLPLYSIVTYMAALKTIDFIVDGIDRSKSLMIVTQKADEICEQLSLEFEEGITIMDGKGYYSDARKSIIYIVLNRFQIIKAKNIVHNLDPNAFITISDIADVFTKNHASLDN
ncbi:MULTISPECIES: YitT family protein [Peptostreptococcus]|uniref:YitT family protein n=2 Tax=Peptostreptococcaceae TaxID=186804 RepID=UPI0028FDED69|nr:MULTISPECIES: YitT family protein [Peptostreptococcus]MDU0964603.1 YitT family protein [Peptostreptococcus anaerobius]MDU0998553.1 YitT family protein [Peptostreptococcus anaerobius]MDU3423112.1 YitT family protein [Peptostreptococcus anaerobius]MDU3430576.1 YitT family protein [Peptostreptococcus sp.]MDU3455936.1 YitT family protein [Peptostreptococcus sp.]